MSLIQNVWDQKGFRLWTILNLGIFAYPLGEILEMGLKSKHVILFFPPYMAYAYSLKVISNNFLIILYMTKFHTWYFSLYSQKVADCEVFYIQIFGLGMLNIHDNWVLVRDLQCFCLAYIISFMSRWYIHWRRHFYMAIRGTWIHTRYLLIWDMVINFLDVIMMIWLFKKKFNSYTYKLR